MKTKLDRFDRQLGALLRSHLPQRRTISRRAKAEVSIRSVRFMDGRYQVKAAQELSCRSKQANSKEEIYVRGDAIRTFHGLFCLVCKHLRGVTGTRKRSKAFRRYGLRMTTDGESLSKTVVWVVRVEPKSP